MKVLSSEFRVSGQQRAFYFRWECLKITVFGGLSTLGGRGRAEMCEDKGLAYNIIEVLLRDSNLEGSTKEF